MAQIIKTTGEVVEVSPENGTDFQLEELWDIVGGYIEIVNLQDGRLLCLDDEGKLKGYEFNDKATQIYHAALPERIRDYCVGDILICKEEEIK